jgi:putative ABC transport system substrate-binding protein
MNRRKFIAALGSAAAWPMAVSAQQRERMRRIGVLLNYAADDPETPSRLAAFLSRLQELGWTVGRNRSTIDLTPAILLLIENMRRNWWRWRPMYCCVPAVRV